MTGTRALVNTLISLSLAAAFFTSRSSAQEQDKVFVYLKPQATVFAEQIKLGDVAEIQGLNEALASMLEALPLGPSPTPGELRTIDRPEIRHQMVVHRIDPVKVGWLGSEQVEVDRKGRTVTRGELTSLVEDYILRCWAGENVRTEIVYANLPENITLSDNIQTLELVNPVQARVSGSLAVSIAALEEGRMVQRIPVSVKVRVFEKVAVLKKELERGTLVEPADVEFREEETTALRHLPIKSLEELAGKRLKRGYQAGQIMTTESLEMPPLIEKGDQVTLVVQYKNVRVGCLGKAWQNGCQGEKIMVRNQYGRNLYGTVQDAHTVLITQY